jgi:hypothetical protein
MAAIVTTLLWLPAGALLALVAYGLFGTTLRDFLSFDGTFHPALGLVAWWAISFVPAYAYAVLVSHD